MNGPRLYRKIPVSIWAIQWTGDNLDRVQEFLGDDFLTQTPIKSCFLVRTIEGPLTASTGDWIVRGIHGEHYPVKPDIFAATYKEVTE